MHAAATLQTSTVENLCFNLSAIRRARSLTQAQLGQAAGITRNHYQLLESGRTATGDIANPRLSTLVALAEVLGVEPPSLLLPARPLVVWRWFAAASDVSDEAIHQIFNELLTASELHLDGDGAAFVGVDQKRVAVAVGLKAPDEAAAEIIATHYAAAAVTSAALEGKFVEEVEIDHNLGALARTSDA